MKKSLIESKVIRFYVLLWGLFVLGILIAFPFGKTQTQWRYVAFAGFLLSMGSFIFAVGMFSFVQVEIKARFLKAIDSEKQFLTVLFYFVRGIPLLLGLLILLFSTFRKDVLAKDVVAVGGKISSIEVIGQENLSLKIGFNNNSNQYGINTFKIPDEKLKQIEEELKVGDSIIVLIGPEYEHAANDKYVQIYGIRTETKIYLSIDEYNKAASVNNSFGYVLGILFAGPGLICLLTGRIKTKPDKATRIEQNASKA